MSDRRQQDNRDPIVELHEKVDALSKKLDQVIGQQGGLSQAIWEDYQRFCQQEANE